MILVTYRFWRTQNIQWIQLEKSLRKSLHHILTDFGLSLIIIEICFLVLLEQATLSLMLQKECTILNSKSLYSVLILLMPLMHHFTLPYIILGPYIVDKRCRIFTILNIATFLLEKIFQCPSQRACLQIQMMIHFL